MAQFKKILVPVDFSEPSRKALTYGLALAHQLNGKLIVAHIVPESSALSYAFPVEMFAIEKQQRDTATIEIKKLVPAEAAAKIDLQTIIRVGRIDDELLGIVKDASIDLVVMGTHGRRYLGRWFIGSVTERMLRRVPIPVLTVSHVQDDTHAVGVGPVTLKRILYAADLSDFSTLGMKYAIDLAQHTGAELIVMHVVEYLNVMYEAAAYLDNERTRRMNEMRKRLDEIVAREIPQSVHAETLVLDGKPYDQILATAESRGIDLIVLNLQSKGILERAFLGATAERVIRLARVPVLSVPVGVTS